jgi:hypothetical protein
MKLEGFTYLPHHICPICLTLWGVNLPCLPYLPLHPNIPYTYTYRFLIPREPNLIGELSLHVVYVLQRVRKV